MAYRRRKTMKKTVRRRTRRTRSVGSVNANKMIGTIAGAIASRFVTNAVGKMIPVVVSSPMNKALTQVALGFVTKPVLGVLGVKSPALDGASEGMIIAGGYELVKTVAPKMMGQADEGDVILISGMEDSADEISEINGLDEIGYGSADELDEINGMDEIGEFDF